MLITVITHVRAYTQVDLPPVYLNHMFIALDENSYRNLLKNTFLKDSFSLHSTDTSVTTTETYYGTYLWGNNSYFELFPPKGYNAAANGGFGLCFMTYTVGDISKTKNQIKKNTKDSIVEETSSLLYNDTAYPSFNQLYFFQKDSVRAITTWIMEYTPSLYKNAGFSDEEIKQKMSRAQFLEKMDRQKYSKAFDHISKVEMIINNEDYAYLNKSLTSFGLKKIGSNFFNPDVKIICTVKPNVITHLKSIETELLGSFSAQTIKISDKLTLKIDGKKAKWIFN